ncbi:MAG: hypothetical protein U0136_19565 [Bdellovibrionota bacterium]
MRAHTKLYATLLVAGAIVFLFVAKGKHSVPTHSFPPGHGVSVGGSAATESGQTVAVPRPSGAVVQNPASGGSESPVLSSPDDADLVRIKLSDPRAYFHLLKRMQDGRPEEDHTPSDVEIRQQALVRIQQRLVAKLKKD